MSQKALTQTGYSANLPETFNQKAGKTREAELKFLVPERSPGEADHSIFRKIETYFAPWTEYTKNKHIVTRQLDTLNRSLLANGHTLRARAECVDNNLDHVKTPDVCLKMDAGQDDSGALVRGEYETRINDFKKVDLKPLLDKYPAEQFPEVHAALAGINSKNLHEYFMIECQRRRILVEFPEEVTGLKGKRFVAELLLDDVAFMLDKKFGLSRRLLFGHDLEIEMEPIYTACAYDTNPGAASIVSSPLTPAEEKQALMAASREIQKASGGILQVNTMSKANRGFDYLDREILKSRMGELISSYDAHGVKTKQIKPAFTIHAAYNDNKKPHHLMNTDFGRVVDTRGFAHYNPK